MQQLALVSKQRIDIGFETAASVVLFHDSTRDVLGLFAMGNGGLEFFALGQVPNPIGLQVPERQFWMSRFSRWPKVTQKPGQLCVDVFKQHEPVVAALKARECEQQQQRLVRRALVAALPHVDIESFEDIVVGSHQSPITRDAPAGTLAQMAGPRQAVPPPRKAMNQQSVIGPRFQPQWRSFCQRCCVEALTQDVTFRQNLGALVVLFHSLTSGELCKSCIHAEFWRRTGITVGIGWLGYISVLVATVFLLMNVYNYG